jgi:hypothetical protein
MASTGVNQSSSLTATVNLTGGFEIQIPIQVTMSAVSAAPVVNIYSTMDGGTKFDTTPFTSFTISQIVGGGTAQATVRLTTGMYAIQMLASGPNSQSFAVLTQLVISSVINV